MGVRAVVTGVAVGLVLVTGCSGGPEQPAATVTPSTVPSTPMASSSPDPSQDPLYLEAVGVYTAYFKEMQKFEAAQYPSDTLPKEMDKYITGSLKAVVAKMVAVSRQEGLVPEEGSSAKLSALAPNPGVSRAGSLISIRICVDSRDVKVVDPVTQANRGQGALVYKEIFFTREDENLKAFTSNAKQVETCPVA